nr:integrase, catalytic region, zinc finger, CCHC-type, peptidase aspartic, catalytic [Tanacetum cinerariifolium]
MFDRSDFEPWKQRIHLYCKGKDNEENIIKLIDECPFKMRKFRETLAEGTEGALHLGPEWDRVVADLTPDEKERYKADIHATNILLQGLPKDIYTLINHYTDAKDIWDNVKMLLECSELTKDEHESQLNDEFEHFHHNKGETIHEYYVRFTKLINDMRNIKMTMPRMQLNSKFVNNMLPEWGGQANTFDDDVDEALVHDLALNEDHIFQADQCDAFDSDVDEASTAQTMFMVNLSIVDPIYDEAGPSYDSDFLSKVQDRDNYLDSVGEYHEVHEMQNDAQPNYVVDSDVEYTSDSNIISYDQHAAQSVSPNELNKVVNESLTAELARYKELVETYEKRARFELTEREQKIDEQLRIIITDRNIKEDSLKKELHYVKIFSELHDAYTVGQASCLELEAEISKLKHKIQKDDHSEMINVFPILRHLRMLLNLINFVLINKMKQSLQGKDNTIRKLKVKISQMNEKRSEADLIIDFKALDSRNKELTEHVTALQEQNARFRAENKKVKQHYKELYDSIKITCAKTIEKTTSLLAENENLKAQLKGKIKRVTMDTVKPKFLAPGMVVVQNVQGQQNRGQRNNLRGAGTTGNGGVQNRVVNENPGQARQIKCYNCNEYFKDKMLLMQAQENGVVLDEEQLLFITGG